MNAELSSILSLLWWVVSQLLAIAILVQSLCSIVLVQFYLGELTCHRAQRTLPSGCPEHKWKKAVIHFNFSYFWALWLKHSASLWESSVVHWYGSHVIGKLFWILARAARWSTFAALASPLPLSDVRSHFWSYFTNLTSLTQNVTCILGTFR